MMVFHIFFDSNMINNELKG